MTSITPTSLLSISDDLQETITASIDSIHAAYEERDRERVERIAGLVGEIGAKLLARHSPQTVLDAYFDAANEVLEANK